MNQVCKPYLDKFFIVFIDDFLIYSKSKEEHEVHLKLVLKLLKKEKLFAKFSKCEFLLQEVHFLRHVVNNDGNHLDPSKIEAVKNWKVSKTPSEIRSFLGLAGYYRCFITNFSKVAKPLTSLTGKNQKIQRHVSKSRDLFCVLMQTARYIAIGNRSPQNGSQRNKDPGHTARLSSRDVTTYSQQSQTILLLQQAQPDTEAQPIFAILALFAPYRCCNPATSNRQGDGVAVVYDDGVAAAVAADSDRVTRKLFEAHRKTPPEKFSGGGDVVAGGGRGGRRWAAGNGRGERESIALGFQMTFYSLIDATILLRFMDALERQMREQLLDTYLRYLQVINDLKKCGYKKDNCELNYKFLNNLQPEWKQYGTLMRQTKNLMDINIDALYNILKQNQGDVNEAMGHKKKAVVVTSDPLALVAEKTKVNKRKEKVAVQSESEGSDDEDISDLKKTYEFHSTFVLTLFMHVYLSSDSDQEISANMVFMAKMEKVLSDSEESSSSTEETIAEVSYYTSDSESESEYETSKYYDNSTNYDHDQSEVDHNNSEEKDHLVDKLIKKFNHKIAKCQKHIEKANQKSKSLENQNKDLQDKYDVLKNQVNIFEEKNNEFNEQIKVFNEKNGDFLAQTDILQEQLKVKHVVIATHSECQAQYAKLEEERNQYMIRYSALCDNDKQHRKKIDEQELYSIR
ncbi:integrase, catalytic region, zinc finger, CCHC-type containing protein [Tanacetum coccineum]